MRVGSLFAGIGGFDLAAERVGMEVVWQSEIDSHASRVLDHHWPHIKNFGDIHGIGCTCDLQTGVRRQDVSENGSDSDDRRSQRWSKPNTDPVLDDGGHCERCGRARPSGVDVLTGGFPCQDYSVAGNREGLAGDRGALWWEYHRLIARLRPTWVVGENVPGLLSSRDGADFETIVGSLTECGYGVAWAVLDAQYFGVAQRRRRVFIVGHSGGEPQPEVLALSEGLYGHPEPRRTSGERTAPTLAARTRGGGWPGSDEAIDGALAFNWQLGGDVRLGVKEEHTDALYSGQTPTVAFAQNQRDEVRELGDLAGGLQSEPGMKQQTYVANTVPTLLARQDDDGFNLSTQVIATGLVRRLTPLECERLQGFPDGWTDIPGNSDTQRYRQLGNAVAVPVAEWLLRRLT